HQVRREESLREFDSVRGVFWEGAELYPNAGFREKDHIQLCIRNPNCIKGYFYPIKINTDYYQLSVHFAGTTRLWRLFSSQSFCFQRSSRAFISVGVSMET